MPVRTSGQHEDERIVLPEYTDEVWHGYLPDARPDLLYGYRVYGPYDPRRAPFQSQQAAARSLRQVVPRPTAVERRGFRLSRRQPARGFGLRPPRQCAVHAEMPRRRARLHLGRRPAAADAWEETIILELHVRGITMRHPGVDPEHRGTFAGLASPAVIDYLVELGVTAVELLPVQAAVDDRQLVQRG